MDNSSVSTGANVANSNSLSPLCLLRRVAANDGSILQRRQTARGNKINNCQRISVSRHHMRSRILKSRHESPQTAIYRQAFPSHAASKRHAHRVASEDESNPQRHPSGRNTARRLSASVEISRSSRLEVQLEGARISEESSCKSLQRYNILADVRVARSQTLSSAYRRTTETTASSEERRREPYATKRQVAMDRAVTFRLSAQAVVAARYHLQRVADCEGLRRLRGTPSTSKTRTQKSQPRRRSCLPESSPSGGSLRFIASRRRPWTKRDRHSASRRLRMRQLRMTSDVLANNSSCR